MITNDVFGLYVVSPRLTILRYDGLTSSCIKLLAAMTEVQEQWAAVKFTGTYADAREHSSQFQTYKQSTKRAWVTEKQDVTTLFGNVQTKLRTYGLREYVPPPGFAIAVGSDT